MTRPRTDNENADLYDLSGEKAAAEALRRDDAFKEQQIQEKAQQTKDFFAEQDRKQQESFLEMQKQADFQLAEKAQKEFWDAKQAQETQAAMEKELQGLHEAAQQEQQQWRADFTQGVCRDDATAAVNAQIDARVGAYQERLSDLGTNAADASATAETYKVKLESEATTEIDNRTAELHQQHFPEYQGVSTEKPGLAPGEIPSTGFGPFEGGPQGGYGLEGLVNKKGDSGPWEATAGPTPDKPFMRDMMDPRGDGTDAPPGWFKNVDELPKQDAPPGWFKNVDAPPADGKDIPDGWMKPIDPPLAERASAAMDAAGSAAAGAMGEVLTKAKESINPETVHAAAEVLDHVKHWGGVSGLPHDVAGQAGEQINTMREHGIEGFKAAIQINVEKAQVLGAEIKAGAQEMAESIKSGAQELKTGAQEMAESIKTGAEGFKTSAQEVAQELKAGAEGFKTSAQEVAQELKTSAQEFKTNAQEVAQELKRSAQNVAQDVKSTAQELGQRVKEGAQEMEGKIKAGAQEVKENLTISSNETIGKMVNEDLKKPETEQNKVMAEVHKQDLDAMLRKREQDLGHTQEQVESAAAAFATHAKAVDQQMQPQAPQTVQANTPGPPVVIPPSTPAVANPTPSIQ